MTITAQLEPIKSHPGEGLSGYALERAYRQELLTSEVIEALENDEFPAEILGVSDKVTYLAHRDNLKAWINILASGQKKLTARTRTYGGDSHAQMMKHYGARVITLLIALRRSGKNWSAKQRSAVKD